MHEVERVKSTHIRGPFPRLRRLNVKDDNHLSLYELDGMTISGQPLGLYGLRKDTNSQNNAIIEVMVMTINSYGQILQS